jgi:1-phosphofructokinase
VIVTLTPNPSLDRTVTLASDLEPGAVHRVTSVETQAAGKGVNIARAAHLADVPTVAVLPAGPVDPLLVALVADGIPVHAEPVAEPARTNLTITTPDGVTTKINEPGASYGADVRERLVEALLDRADQTDWYVLAGSLPPGCPDDWYADIVQRLRVRGAHVAVDTSDAALTTLVAGLPGTAPTLMKPNGAELASLIGADTNALEADPLAAARAALTLVERGVSTVLVSLGAYGAVLVTEGGAWHATPPPTTVLSTVGAGDSALFGYLYADHLGHQDPAVRLAWAVAYGSAAAALPATTVPQPHTINPEKVVVVPLPNLRKVTR